MTDYADTTPAAPRAWRGPRTIATVEHQPGRLARIVFTRLQALTPRYATSLPLTVGFTPPSPRRIPASARDAAGHFSRKSGKVAAKVPTVPLPPSQECIAMRQRLGLSQRDAASGAKVSRSLVSELESPRPDRKKGTLASPIGEVYVAWLQSQVEALSAREATS